VTSEQARNNPRAAASTAECGDVEEDEDECEDAGDNGGDDDTDEEKKSGEKDDEDDEEETMEGVEGGQMEVDDDCAFDDKAVRCAGQLQCTTRLSHSSRSPGASMQLMTGREG
jgi:hypothetical protein